MAFVVFLTTYIMILPALTIDVDTVAEEPGMEVAAAGNDSDQLYIDEAPPGVGESQTGLLEKLSESGEPLFESSAAFSGELVEEPYEAESASEYAAPETGDITVSELSVEETSPEMFDDSALPLEEFGGEPTEGIAENSEEFGGESEEGFIEIPEEFGEEPMEDVTEIPEEITEVLPEDEQESVDDVTEPAEFLIDGAEVQEDIPGEAEDVDIDAAESASAHVLKAEGYDYRVTVSYPDEAEIPDGAELLVTEILSDELGYDQYVSEAADALSTEKRIMSVDNARFFDITIIDGDVPVEPKAPVTVLVELADSFAASEDAAVIHYTEEEVKVVETVDPEEAAATIEEAEAADEAAAQAEMEEAVSAEFSADVLNDTYETATDGLESEEISEEIAAEEIFGMEELPVVEADPVEEELPFVGDESVEEELFFDETMNQIAFVADSFSVYGFVTATIEKTILASDGHNYKITVTCGADAGIPEDAELVVREILPEDEEYSSYYDDAAATAEEDAKNRGMEFPVVAGVRLFDIEICDENGKIEPAAPVNVDIRLSDAEAEIFSVVHFAKDGPEAVTLKEASSAEYVPEEEMLDESSAGIISFEAEAFSVYTVVQVNNGNVSEIVNGGPFVLATEIADAREVYPETWGNDYFTKFVNAMAVNYNHGYTLSGGIASIGIHLWDENGQGFVGGEATEWYFEPNGTQGYRIYCMDGETKHYIMQNGHFDGGNNWILERGLSLTENQSWASTFEFIPNSDGTVLIKNISGNWYMHNNSFTWSGDNNEWSSRNYMMDQQNDGSDAFTWGNYKFRLSKKSDVHNSYAAEKVSVTSITPQDNILIYRKFVDESGNETLYALTGDGTFVRVYDGGDYIYWRETDKCVTWNYSRSSSGGHRLSSVSSDGEQVYLHPVASTDPKQTMGSSAVSLTLQGKDNGEYGTTITRWDEAAYDYAGLHVSMADGVPVLTAGTIGSGTADEFLFAIGRPMPSDTAPEEVDTVNSAELGIKITMFDYGIWDHEYDAGTHLPEMTRVAGSDDYTPHAAHALVRKYLENGLPVNLSGNPMTGLFDPVNGWYVEGDQNSGAIRDVQYNVNRLFLQSYYDEIGMFRYRSEDNYAYLGLDGTDFKVYRQAATPYTSNLSVGHSYYYHGHFMPYNDIDMTQSVSRLMDQYGNASFALDLPIGDGRTYEEIYGIQGTPNYFVGMKMEASFVQPRDGKMDNGDDMIFKFTGDDDMWVYIDDVLVLDVGGIHEPLSGTINFATGEVTNPQGSSLAGSTTLRAIFMAALADENTPQAVKDKISSIEWDGDTFADYTNHEFKSFYMERGAGASNLDLQFNLKVTRVDEFTVEKELPENVDTRFINQKYRYRATFMDGNDVKPLFPGQHNANGDEVCLSVIYKGLKDNEGHPVPVSVDNDGYFYLNPGEIAVFKMKDETIPYNVEEVGIDTVHIEKVEINGDEVWKHEDWENDPSKTTAEAGFKTGYERSNVLFLNYPFTQNLLITKHLTADSAPVENGEDPRFEFLVYLESKKKDGTGTELVPYSWGSYYLVKDGEIPWHYYTLDGEDNNSPVDRGTNRDNVMPSSAGLTGSISKIPVGYTILIPDLGVDTHFYIEEVLSKSNGDSNLPQGYEYVKAQSILTENSYSAPTLPSAGDIPKQNFDQLYGKIKRGTDADAHVYNKKEGIPVTVKKIWEPTPEDPNASVTVELHRYARETKGTLNVTLVDQHSAAIEGAVFKLQKLGEDGLTYEDTGITVTTDVNGNAGVSNLEPGVYKLVQVSVPEGYRMGTPVPETNPFEVLDNLTTHQEHSETLHNTRLVTEGIVTLTVSDSVTHEMVNGATFTLIKDGDPFKTGLITGETGEPGKIIVSGLPAGHYYFVQTGTPPAYNMPVETTTQVFQVQEAPGVEQQFSRTMENVPKATGMITVTLKKKDDNSPIAGATIALLQNDLAVETLNTDENGQVVFGEGSVVLFEGNYIVRQLNTGEAGNDYRVDSDKAVVIDGTGVHQQKTVNLFDEGIGKGTVTVTVNTEANSPVSGARVQLIKDGTILEYGETDANGQIVFGTGSTVLYEGDYVVRQVNTGNVGDDYRLAADQTVTIEPDGGPNQQKTVSMIDNLKGKGLISVTLRKKDDKTPISGAMIQLIKNGQYVDQITTDASGQGVFSNVYEGDYVVHQITKGNTPTGYDYANDYPVSISADGGQSQQKTVLLESDVAGGNVTIKLWRKGGFGQWNWDNTNTYTGLKAGKTYSFTATMNSGLYPNNVWFYCDTNDHSNSDSIAVSKDDLANPDNLIYDNGTYHFTFTPQQDNTVYSLILISEWGVTDIKTFVKEDETQTMSATSASEVPHTGVSMMSARWGRSIAGTEDLIIEEDTGLEPVFVGAPSQNTAEEAETSRAAVTAVSPAEPPEGYAEDSSFSVITRELTGPDWELTFPDQAKVDADGYPYYYYVKEVACSLDYYELTDYSNDPVSADDNKTIEITNTRKKGSLKINKTGTVNGSSDTNGLLNGTYTFTVSGDANTQTARNTVTVKITLTNGVATAAIIDGTPNPSEIQLLQESGDVVIENGVVTLINLPTGHYTVTEDTTGLAAKGINIVGTNPQPVTVIQDGTGSCFCEQCGGRKP